ncbi:hypothetical protein [Sanguibacter sp. HDW7]|uniref:hypothetical protein n=1 Tax=Sanguibacter sp. HDW7 TaxID=2714931 RepID=UPI001407B120|nr:hypothetical protein [Sanguibacter sp. HDW7]QIK82666.1 hypothetical protein G7063_02800 [Sanguibacter sp. HDW7]
MTQGTGPARRDLWGEQGLRPTPVAPAPVAPTPGQAVAPSTSSSSAPHTATGTAQAPPPPADPASRGATGPDAHPASAPPVPPDDESTRIDGDVLDRAREHRDRPRRRRLRLLGAGAALALVGGGTWAALRDDPAPGPPPLPAPTLEAEQLSSILASLERASTSDGLAVLGAATDTHGIDPRRADLLQPAEPVDVTLRSAAVLWSASAADLLGTIAQDVGVTDTELDAVAVLPARPSATVASPSSTTAVAVVRRGTLDEDLWRDLLDEAGSKTALSPSSALVVGVDVTSGTARWVRPLHLSQGTACQSLDAGTFVACDSAEVTDELNALSREVVVLEAATGKVDTSVEISTGCPLTSIAQHAGVLYWAGREGDSVCVGSGTSLMGTWISPDAPVISVTTDGRILFSTVARALVRSVDGTWRAFAGTVEPGPDRTVLRTFARDELTGLSPLSLRDVSADGTSFAPRFVTLVTAEDGTTISALPGAAWHRDDLLMGSGVTTPDFLEGRSGVGDWIVSADGARERLVHAGDERFADEIAPWVVERGVAGVSASLDETAPVLVVDASGQPVPQEVRDLLLSHPYGGGQVGAGQDTAKAEPVPGVKVPERPENEEIMAWSENVTVVGADGTSRTTTAVALLAESTSSPVTERPSTWLATGGVVVLPLGSALVGIG